MLTRELVDELCERFKGWGADGPHGVLRYLDQAHYILMTQESHQTFVYDMNTGELPKLETVRGKRVYQLKEHPQIWRVGGVMLRNTTGGMPGKEVRVTGEFYWAVDGVRTRDWLSHDDPAMVTFTFDPTAGSGVTDRTTVAVKKFNASPPVIVSGGTSALSWEVEETTAAISDRTYYLRAWCRSKQLTSVRINHLVPPPNDVLYLLPAAAKLIEGVQNGEVIESRLWIEKELKPKFWAAMNKGEQSEYTEPVDRGF
jgi:hypothetical protein